MRLMSGLPGRRAGCDFFVDKSKNDFTSKSNIALNCRLLG